MLGRCQEDIVPFPWGEYSGRCRTYPYHEGGDKSFEGWFLQNEAYSNVAKRYAEKFCPERVYIIDRLQERVTQRARLGMSHERKDDMIV